MKYLYMIILTRIVESSM